MKTHIARSAGRSRRPLLRITLGLLTLGLALEGAGCGPLGLESPGEAPAPRTGGAEDQAVALVIEGESVTLGELHEHMQAQFLEEILRQPEDELFSLHERAVRDLVQRRVIDAAAAEAGVSAEDLFEQVTGEAPTATVEDVAQWYTQNQGRLRGARLEDVADQIKDMLDGEARTQAWASFVGPRVEALDWQMVIEPPRKSLVATRLVRGDAEAPVTIMAFSDYQCPYCIRSEPVLAEVLERYPGEVRLVHRHFPLDGIHPLARPASEAAMCADEQGLFWEFHDAIFARSGRLTETSFAEIGGELGLDVDALGTCIDERRYEAFVQADFEAGQEAGVTGTPAFFVNGIPLKGARDADDLSRVVESELARLRTP